jgi:hypothetical protein
MPTTLQQTTSAGYYSVAGSATPTGLCAPGYYCPAGSSGPMQVSLDLTHTNKTVIFNLTICALHIYEFHDIDYAVSLHRLCRSTA